MREVWHIVKDVLSGALPLTDTPHFAVCLLGRTFWWWFGACVIGALCVVCHILG